MVSVRERVTADGEVVYQVRFRHQGRQTSETFDTVRGRDRFLRNVGRVGVARALDILDHTDASAVDENVPSLGEWVTRYIESRTGVGESQVKKYRAYLRNDLAHLADVPLDEVGHDAVAKWVNRMKADGAAAKTIANKHGFLSGALNQAVARKVIPANPCEETKLPRGIEPEMVFLTPGEFAHLVHYIPDHYEPLVTTMVSTGLRYSEATALRVRDVDLDHATVRVARAWKKADTGFVIGPPKSKKGNRTVSLADQCVPILAPLVDRRPPDDLVFTTPRGAPVRHAVFLQGIWQPAVRLANGEPAEPTDLPARKRPRASAVFKDVKPADEPLGKRPTPHALRHTAASWWLASGMDLLSVSYQLGHESITTTSNRYGHLLPERRVAAAAAMTSMLAQAFPEVEPADAQPRELESA